MTTGELFDARTGEFTITEHEKYDNGYESALAQCEEGGRVWVERKDQGWERREVLPIFAPHSAAGEPVFVVGSLNEVLREGCRGKGYLRP